MATRVNDHERATSQVGRLRRIGSIGTAARVILGLMLVGSVIWGDWSSGLVLASWALGLVGFPAVFLAWQ